MCHFAPQINFLLIIEWKAGIYSKGKNDCLDEIPTGDIYIIPVRLDESKPVDRKLQDIQWVDLFPSYENGLEKIKHIFTLEQSKEKKSTDNSTTNLYNDKNGNLNNEVNHIEFANRLNETDEITTPYCAPYLLISAPKEYGKTRLLEVVKTELQKQEWRCIHIKLSTEKEPSRIKAIAFRIFEQLGKNRFESQNFSEHEKLWREIGKCIIKVFKNNNQRYLLILIDEAESISEYDAKCLVNQHIPSMNEILNNVDNPIKIRLIFAGRYISNWKKWSNIPFKVISLTPFDFSTVHQTVEKFDETWGMSLHYKKEFVSHLMYFTGGHPACMANILRENYGEDINNINWTGKECYEAIIKPVTDEIKIQISEELQTIFETLSVIRCFNPLLLRNNS
ncbi:MAG: hypothetical protein GY795_10820 [Desulfobacterales bacterium]|nr:hypothetical protein [Desulfobacterales bacterium]